MVNILLILVVGLGVYLYADNMVNQATAEEPIPRHSLFDFNGYECWLDYPTDITYKTGSPNIVVGITCPLEVQYIFQPAVEPEVTE